MDQIIDYLDEAAHWRKKAQLHGSGLSYWFCIVQAKEALRYARTQRNFMAPLPLIEPITPCDDRMKETAAEVAEEINAGLDQD